MLAVGLRIFDLFRFLAFWSSVSACPRALLVGAVFGLRHRRPDRLALAGVDRIAPHLDPRTRAKSRSLKTVPLKPVAELAHRRLLRGALAPEVDANQRAKRTRVVDWKTSVVVRLDDLPLLERSNIVPGVAKQLH